MKQVRGPFESLVVLGESTVQGGGWLERQEERWPDIVARLVETAQEAPLRYHNAGLGASVIAPSGPGYDASVKPSAAERLEEQVLAHEPDLLVIAYGLNDMRSGMEITAFRREYEALLRRVRERLDPLIVLVSVYHMTDYQYYPPFNKGSVAATKAYNAMLKKVAEAHDCAFADAWGAEGQCAHVVHQDTCHANKIGNLLIAHEVFKAIVHAAPGMARHMNARDATTEWTRRTEAMKREGVEQSATSRPGE